jgi:hypothetical protein
VTISALPEHLRTKEAWAKTDQNVWYKRWWIMFRLKYLTFAPRATERYAKWRDCPKILFAWRGNGLWRVEEKTGKERIGMDENTLHSRPDGYFLSRIQPFTRFHVAIHWPLLITWSVFWKPVHEEFDAHKYKKRTIKELFCGYLGAKYDPVDQVYFVSLFAGGSWE